MILFEDIINEELTRKKDAEEKPTARVQEEAFRRGLPVEGLFVQSTEVSGKESNMIICVLERGEHTQNIHTRRDLCIFLPPSQAEQSAPTDFSSLFLTGRLVLVAAAGWHGKGTNPKKSLHPAPTPNPVSLTYALTFPNARTCPGHPQEL